MSKPDLSSFAGARSYVEGSVLPELRTHYEGSFRPVFGVIATVDAEGGASEPFVRRVATDFELDTPELRSALAEAARQVFKDMGAIGFVMMVDAEAAGLVDRCVAVWLDHVGGSDTWVAPVVEGHVGEFEPRPYAFGPELERMLPARWMN